MIYIQGEEIFDFAKGYQNMAVARTTSNIRV